MLRRRWHFGRLHWRLTRSYVLVMLVVAFVFELALTASYDTQQSQYVARRPLFARALLQLVVPQLVPQLTLPSSSETTLQDWVTTFLHESIQYSGATSDLGIDPSMLVCVLDGNGQILASAVDAAHPAKATRHLLLRQPAQVVIRAALAGDTRPADLVRAFPTGETVIAVPILAAGNRVVGVLVDIQQAPYQFGTPLDVILVTATFAIAAGIVGTVAGLLASRGITRRLRRLALAAHAWSRGEFQVAVRDRSRDELGQLARDLNSMAEQLQALFSTRQELATVEERQRLARDLHDSVKQDVFATALLVGAARTLVPADQEQAQAYLAEAEGLAEQARRELTTLIHELRPVALEGKGLATALQEYARRWSVRTGIVSDLQVAGECAVPIEAATALFRVAQEALANVARHSGADHVDVWLTCNDEVAYLQIRDNGKGFDTTQSAGMGVGLVSMRERIEAHQGTIEINSSPSGTVVQARLPVRSALAAQEVGR
jgi:NarL family two-component system sensor histidine kinase LiaS